MPRPELAEIALEQIAASVPIPRPPLKMRLQADEGILFLSFPDPGRETRRHVLNPTAGVIYRLADGTRSVGEIVELFSARFPEVPRSVLAYDIVHTIRSFERKELIAPLHSCPDPVTDERPTRDGDEPLCP